MSLIQSWFNRGVSSSSVFELRLPACNANDPGSPVLCSAHRPDDWPQGLLVILESGSDWSSFLKLS